MVRTSFSPVLPWVTVQVAPSSLSLHGGFIQLSGLKARSSAWMLTLPSALMSTSLGAIGRCAVSRPM